MAKGKRDWAFWRAFVHYLCGCRTFPKIFLPSEKKVFIFYIRAVTAIYGSIIFWVGSWNLLTEAHPYTTNGDSTFELFNDDISRELFYMLVGGVFLFLTDTLYGNAGLPGGYYPPSMLCATTWSALPRVIVGLLGSGR